MYFLIEAGVSVSKLYGSAAAAIQSLLTAALCMTEQAVGGLMYIALHRIILHKADALPKKLQLIDYPVSLLQHLCAHGTTHLLGMNLLCMHSCASSLLVTLLCMKT